MVRSNRGNVGASTLIRCTHTKSTGTPSAVSSSEIPQPDYNSIVDFPNGDVLRISAMKGNKWGLPDGKWLEEMLYFLTGGLPPPQMRTDEKK